MNIVHFCALKKPPTNESVEATLVDWLDFATAVYCESTSRRKVSYVLDEYKFFPKGMKFVTVTQKDVDRAVRNMNHRPRKRLGYLTPHEVFVKGLQP